MVLSAVALRKILCIVTLVQQHNSTQFTWKGMEAVMKKFICNWMLPLLLSIIICFTVSRFVFIVTVSTSSMDNTLKKGDILLVTCINLEKLGYGDIIVFNHRIFNPNEAAYDEKYVKRLIGLPGDEIDILNNQLYINNKIIKEKYIYDDGDTRIFSGEFSVPNNEYFVLGDNRNISFDSRYWDYPYVKKEDIVGKVIFNFSNLTY